MIPDRFEYLDGEGMASNWFWYPDRKPEKEGLHLAVWETDGKKVFKDMNYSAGEWTIGGQDV